MESQRYIVRAIDGQQHVVELDVEALDLEDLGKHVQSLGLSVLSHRPASRLRDGALPWNTQSFNLLLFLQEAHALISAGLSVPESMEALLDRASDETHRLVTRKLLDDLRQGLRLSQAVERQPRFFPPLLVGIIQSAEDTSDLPRALLRFLQYETQLRDLRQRITSASIYPAILMGVGSLVALFLLGYPPFSCPRCSCLVADTQWLRGRTRQLCVCRPRQCL